MNTRITQLLGIEYPILQGGMAWIAESTLASAVSNGGGAGIIAGGSAPIDYLREQIRKTKSLTDKPFGVNIMLMSPNADDLAQLVIDEKVSFVTTGAGNPAKYIKAWKDANIKVIPVVSTVNLAKRMERSGADGNGATFLCARHHEPQRQLHGEPVHIEDGLPTEIKPYIIQNGKEVYKFATKILPMATRMACQKIDLPISDIDFFIPHQANIRIIETACKNLDSTMDKFIVNIAEHGNTSSATIPIAFDEAIRSGKIKRGDKICFVGFGAGLTYGAVVIEY